MEAKINIAEILKDKPQGTKLYDWLYNRDVELDTISTTDTETVVWCTNETDNNTTCHRGYSEFGTVRGCPDGLQILFPSKSMQDWSKFAWKKGDVLVSNDGEETIFLIDLQTILILNLLVSTFGVNVFLLIDAFLKKKKLFLLRITL